MGRYDDIDPQDINPETGQPYPGYSSPCLDTTLHDIEMDIADPDPNEIVSIRRGDLDALAGAARTYVDDLVSEDGTYDEEDDLGAIEAALERYDKT